MTDKAQGEIAHETTSEAGKRAWVAPRIDTAPARGADAFGGPAGASDYGLYS